MSKGMTVAGWIFMIINWGWIISLAGYCFYRVLATTHGKHSDKNPEQLP